MLQPHNQTTLQLIIKQTLQLSIKQLIQQLSIKLIKLLLTKQILKLLYNHKFKSSIKLIIVLWSLMIMYHSNKINNSMITLHYYSILLSTLTKYISSIKYLHPDPFLNLSLHSLPILMISGSIIIIQENIKLLSIMFFLLSNHSKIKNG